MAEIGRGATTDKPATSACVTGPYTATTRGTSGPEGTGITLSSPTRRRALTRRSGDSRSISGVISVATTAARYDERRISTRCHEGAAATAARWCHPSPSCAHLPNQNLQNLPSNEIDPPLQHHAAAARYGATSAGCTSRSDLVRPGYRYLPVLEASSNRKQCRVAIPRRRV